MFELTPGANGVWTETIIHTFAGYPLDGADPLANLVTDAAGNLYGTTWEGGNADLCGDQYNAASCGTVFELSPNGDYWKEIILHNFQGGNDGCLPAGGLIFDQGGILYGTTESNGGNGYDCAGPGTVFTLSPSSNGAWTEQIIYAFSNPNDYGYPTASLLFDSSGNLYGTDAAGVFELSPASGGSWTESMSIPTGGSLAPLIFDSAGNLYGTTSQGGSSSACYQGCGSVFELSPGTNGWSLSTLYSFTDGSDGGGPSAALLFDSAGNLVTTASGGGNSGCRLEGYIGGPGCGTVVKLTSSAGIWVLSAFYDFPSPTDGGTPMSNLIADAAGNLYGTTEYGGNGACLRSYSFGCGTVFELSPTANGKWTTKILYSFQGTNGDGQNPVSPLTFDQAGNLYGMTLYGGSTNGDCGPYGCGTVFELSPSTDGTWTEQVIYEFTLYPGWPTGPLVIDKQGALYGISASVIFQLTPSNDGVWQAHSLYNFGSQDLGATLVADKEGNLYGTTLDPEAFTNLDGAQVSSLRTLFEFSGSDWRKSGSSPWMTTEIFSA